MPHLTLKHTCVFMAVCCRPGPRRSAPNPPAIPIWTLFVPPEPMRRALPERAFASASWILGLIPRIKRLKAKTSSSFTAIRTLKQSAPALTNLSKVTARMWQASLQATHPSTTALPRMFRCCCFPQRFADRALSMRRSSSTSKRSRHTRKSRSTATPGVGCAVCTNIEMCRT